MYITFIGYLLKSLQRIIMLVYKTYSTEIFLNPLAFCLTIIANDENNKSIKSINDITLLFYYFLGIILLNPDYALKKTLLGSAGKNV